MRRRTPAQSENSNQMKMTPEFQNWLKSKNVSRREIRRNPEALKNYYKEWVKASSPRKQRSSLFNFSGLNIGDIGSHVSKAQDILNVIRQLQEMFGKGKLF